MSSSTSSRILRLCSTTPRSRINEKLLPFNLYQYCLRPSCLAESRPRYERRTFTVSHSSRAALASHPPAQSTVLLAYPSITQNGRDEYDEDEADIDLVPLEEAQIEITDRAAEQLRTIAKREGNPNAALRISVESGGCHGYQYKMELATSGQPDDYHFSHPALKPSNIVVDAVSMSLLKGSTIDFATELIGSSFRVVNNPQAKGSGCGCGVSWELKI